MEKIEFTFDETDEIVEFFIVEQTKVNGNSYLLVADSNEEEAECLILKDTAQEDAEESVYEIVEDDVELLAVSKIFEDLLEDIGIEI